MLLKKYKLTDDLNYFFYHTKKYKSFSIKIYFLLPYDKNKITIRNLLKDVLLYDSKNYSNTEIIEKRKGLYNLKVSINSTPLNNLHQYCLTISGTNPKFFNDSDYTLEKIFEYLQEILFKPNIKNNLFNEDSYKTCFNRYKVALKTALEDKNFIAYNESIETLDDDINKYSSYGYLEDFDNISNKKLYKEYLELINSKIIISCIGDLDSRILKKNLKKIFFKSHEYKDKAIMTPTKYQMEREKIIELKTEQAIMVMIFATEVEKFNKDYFDLLVFNMIFGGDSNSKLFQVIREKYGFCYEIYSSVEANSGLVSVFIGLDSQNINKAKELILLQLEEIKKGNFTKVLMKELINNEYNKVQSVYDNIQGTLNREISLYLYNRDSSMEILKKDLKKINKESIKEFANRVKLINTIIIKPKGEINHANN